MALKDPDDNLVVLFKHHHVRNATRSLKEGREIFDDLEIVEIRLPGSKDVKAFPATAFSHWLDNPFTGEQTAVTYAERFARQYQQFKAKAAQTKSGTPLDLAAFLTEARRAELRAQNVYTVEQLAAIEGTELKNLGPYGRDLKNNAVAFIEEGRASAPNQQMMAELEALRARNAVLEGDAKILAAKAAAAAPGDIDFDDMTPEQLRDYITTHTGQAPIGNLSPKSLKRLAIEARPSKAA